jgi:hypothetical protein
MVIGIVIYQFNINQSDMGEIEPKFSVISEEMSQIFSHKDISSYLSIEEKFRLFFNHTTGLKRQSKGRTLRNVIVGRLKSTRHNYFSYYQKTESERQFITLCLFSPDQDVDLFQETFYALRDRVDGIFEEITDETLKRAQQINQINRKLLNALKFTIFQIERLENLSKVQKAALIYQTFERQKCLAILRESPILKSSLRKRLSVLKENINLDVILGPFLELNLVKRDWAAGTKDPVTKKIKDQGEFLFLVKDLIFIRKPPQKLYETIKSNRLIGKKYDEALQDFYAHYDPFADPTKESEMLAHIVLNPDIYDLLALLQTRAYPVKKIPNVISEFNLLTDVLDRLEKHQIIKRIEDITGNFWICLLCEITPMVVYPEYMIPNIQDRTLVKKGAIDPESLYSPLSREVGMIALNLLESSFNEEVKFGEFE